MSEIQAVLFKVPKDDPENEHLGRYIEIFTEDMGLELCAPWYIETLPWGEYYVFPVKEPDFRKVVTQIKDNQTQVRYLTK